ncbi:hypothetical protein [Streptomyces sp. NPDC088730]|uniref:hypothetical protein n=1 Tax=Streptomyces sp. NPDC088730 TaxID=3365877 RepID=UPI003824F09F
MKLRRRPTPAVPVATFDLSTLAPGTRWLVCETTTCAHLTRRHTPAGTGYRCTTCGILKGDS